MRPKRSAKGLAAVVANLNAEIAGIKERSVEGLLTGALLVQGRSQKLVPVELGNLKASAFARKSPDNPMAVELGYTAAYALFIHENMEQSLKGEERPSGIGVYWGPQGQPKFLEQPLNESRDEILELAAQSAEVKP